MKGKNKGPAPKGKNKQPMPPAYNPRACMVNFSEVDGAATEEQIREVFGAYGQVVSVDLFRSLRMTSAGQPGANKGRGMVTMGNPAQAVAVQDGLNGKHVWEGMQAPMVVKCIVQEPGMANMTQAPMVPLAQPKPAVPKAAPAPPASQQQQQVPKAPQAAMPAAPLQQQQQQAQMQAAQMQAMQAAFKAQMQPNHTGAGAGNQAPTQAQVQQLQAQQLHVQQMQQQLQQLQQLPSASMLGVRGLDAATAGLLSGGGGGSGTGGNRGGLMRQDLGGGVGGDMGGPPETPPAGCAPDAIKLFVGNIPRQYTEDQLLPFFETVGKVVELVIIRDKATFTSKGSAFVWYGSRLHAEQAIARFHLQHVLPGTEGHGSEPLVVKVARPRAPKPFGFQHHQQHQQHHQHQAMAQQPMGLSGSSWAPSTAAALQQAYLNAQTAQMQQQMQQQQAPRLQLGTGVFTGNLPGSLGQQSAMLAAARNNLLLQNMQSLGQAGGYGVQQGGMGAGSQLSGMQAAPQASSVYGSLGAGGYGGGGGLSGYTMMQPYLQQQQQQGGGAASGGGGGQAGGLSVADQMAALSVQQNAGMGQVNWQGL